MSPARDASAASSSAASIDQSSRGQPLGSLAVGSTPTRPAAVRPVSSTMTTRRSRSGRQVRTTTSARRAVARQSIERTSSPTTYSRSESNSVPCPRVSTGSSPSISRSLASRDGKCLRDRNGGRMRTCRRHVVRSLPARQAERADRARGDCRCLLVAAPDRLQPGDSVDALCRATRSTAMACGAARALGGQASRTSAFESTTAGVVDHRPRVESVRRVAPSRCVTRPYSNRRARARRQRNVNQRSSTASNASSDEKRCRRPGR